MVKKGFDTTRKHFLFHGGNSLLFIHANDSDFLPLWFSKSNGNGTWLRMFHGFIIGQVVHMMGVGKGILCQDMRYGSQPGMKNRGRYVNGECV